MEALHFTTSNAPLAHALTVCGFKLLAVWNVYTDATLMHLKMPDVKTAKANRLPGAITYVFARADDLPAALKAWNETGKALKANKPEGTSITCLALPVEKVEDAMALARAVMFTHSHFFALWLKVPARYIQRGDGDVKIEPNPEFVGTEVEATFRTERHPGMKVISEGTSEADRQKIL